MKYGLLIGFLTPFANYGDFIQSIAVEYLYKQMGVDDKDIVHITMEQLQTYNGEPIILPYCYFYSLLINSKTGKLNISSKIIPVFLGVTLSDNSYRNFLDNERLGELVGFMKKYEPIGCRDEYTRKLLVENGVNAYLQGCITNILPLRDETTITPDKVMLIDCPIEAKEYIPKQILSNVEVVPNSFYVANMTSEEIYQNAKEHYRYIRDNASMIISSRYHVCTPCNAMGIPVIFTKRVFDLHNQDVRLDTLNPTIPLYEEDEFCKLNYNVERKNFEYLKAIVTNIAIARIKNEIVDKKLLDEIYNFYLPRILSYNSNKLLNRYKEKLQKYINENYKFPEKVSFYIWGAKPNLCNGTNINIVNYILRSNPNAVFKGWIDTYKTGVLADYRIFSPEELVVSESEFIVIMSENGLVSILEKVENMGLSKNQYIICCNQHITKEDLKRV